MEPPAVNKLTTIDSITLTPLVRKALNQAEAEVVDWKYETLNGASFNSDIYRFSGSAHSRDALLTWSLILKTIRSPDGEDDPTSLQYWKREALAYQSGLLDSLPGGLGAPQCFGIVEQPDREIWLWLEEIVDAGQTNWPLETYGRAANQLGQFNGAYISKQLLSEPWLAKGRLRAWVANSIPVIPVPAKVLAHPLVARYYPDNIYRRLLGVWSVHQTWLTLIEQQPQTLAHLDAFRRNMFTRHLRDGATQTVLIDWALLGSAALGEEIAPLVAASLAFLEVDASQARMLDQVVFESYLAGLKAAGWQGDPQMVRFTYAAASVLRYSVGVAGITSMIADAQQQASLERAFGHPLGELVDVWARTNRFLLELADEAQQLYHTLQ